MSGIKKSKYGPGKTETILKIFTSAQRKGEWAPPGHLQIFALFGGIILDFRQARLQPGRTRISALLVFGLVDIIVPPGLQIEAVGSGIFGSFDNKSDQPVDPHLPVLHLEGFAIFGSVTIKVMT